MNNNVKIEFEPKGICCKKIELELQGDKIVDINFIGGCQGNLQGIKQLVKGQDISIVSEKLKGIKCGAKPTSCPDQLANCLSQYVMDQHALQKR